MNKMMEALKAHPSALVGLLGAALIAGVAFALSTQPLVPRGGGAGSAGSTPAVAGSSAGSARASSPAPDEIGSDYDAVGDTAGGGEGDAPAEDHAGEAKTQAGSPADKGGSSQGGASAAKPSKPSSGGSAGGTTQKPAAGGGQAQKPSSGGGQAQKPKPSHTHSWQAVYRTEPVYEQQWVSKWEDVFVKVQERYLCGCGATFYSWNECTSHRAAQAEAGNPCGGYVDDSYEVWEKRDNGSYQSVQTGTRQVLDHYECACGARK